MKTRESNIKRILVVEDEPEISAFCWRVLTSEGFDVDIAVQGKVAQEMLEKKQYDLCLIDIRLPVLDGKELYQWLKERHPKLVNGVIFTTGDIMGGGDTQIILEQAERPLLPKPFTPNDLKAIVREALRQLEK